MPQGCFKTNFGKDAVYHIAINKNYTINGQSQWKTLVLEATAREVALFFQAFPFPTVFEREGWGGGGGVTLSIWFLIIWQQRVATLACRVLSIPLSPFITLQFSLLEKKRSFRPTTPVTKTTSDILQLVVFSSVQRAQQFIFSLDFNLVFIFQHRSRRIYNLSVIMHDSFIWLFHVIRFSFDV